MRVVFTEKGWDDYQWINEYNRPLLKRLNQLIKETLRTPFEGLGKPEPLKGGLSGFWSRRLNNEHRLVYAVKKTQVVIISCRFHYAK
jgi:toxin YoeB